MKRSASKLNEELSSKESWLEYLDRNQSHFINMGAGTVLLWALNTYLNPAEAIPNLALSISECSTAYASALGAINTCRSNSKQTITQEEARPSKKLKSNVVTPVEPELREIRLEAPNDLYMNIEVENPAVTYDFGLQQKLQAEREKNSHKYRYPRDPQKEENREKYMNNRLFRKT